MKAGYKVENVTHLNEDNCIYVENNIYKNKVVNFPIKYDYKNKFKKIEREDIGVWKIKQLKTNN